jgi:hypothetical protein
VTAAGTGSWTVGTTGTAATASATAGDGVPPALPPDSRFAPAVGRIVVSARVQLVQLV